MTLGNHAGDHFEALHDAVHSVHCRKAAMANEAQSNRRAVQKSVLQYLHEDYTGVDLQGLDAEIEAELASARADVNFGAFWSNASEAQQPGFEAGSGYALLGMVPGSPPRITDPTESRVTTAPLNRSPWAPPAPLIAPTAAHYHHAASSPPHKQQQQLQQLSPQAFPFALGRFEQELLKLRLPDGAPSMAHFMNLHGSSAAPPPPQGDGSSSPGAEQCSPTALRTWAAKARAAAALVQSNSAPDVHAAAAAEVSVAATESVERSVVFQDDTHALLRIKRSVNSGEKVQLPGEYLLKQAVAAARSAPRAGRQRPDGDTAEACHQEGRDCSTPDSPPALDRSDSQDVARETSHSHSERSADAQQQHASAGGARRRSAASARRRSRSASPRKPCNLPIPSNMQLGIPEPRGFEAYIETTGKLYGQAQQVPGPGYGQTTAAGPGGGGGSSHHEFAVSMKKARGLNNLLAKVRGKETSTATSSAAAEAVGGGSGEEDSPATRWKKARPLLMIPPREALPSDPSSSSAVPPLPNIQSASKCTSPATAARQSPAAAKSSAPATGAKQPPQAAKQQSVTQRSLSGRGGGGVQPPAAVVSRAISVEMAKMGVSTNVLKHFGFGSYQPAPPKVSPVVLSLRHLETRHRGYIAEFGLSDVGFECPPAQAPPSSVPEASAAAAPPDALDGRRLMTATRPINA